LKDELELADVSLLPLQARVEAAGGQILFWNGVRVMGLLAVSRAIGDHSLRPYVIAEPEVTIVSRHADDELLLLASDGLWDVMDNQEAVTLAKKCVRRARQRGSSRQSAARVAATVLTRAAVDRGSRDNVTVVIVDLTWGKEDDVEAAEHGPGATPQRALGEVPPSLEKQAAQEVAPSPTKPRVAQPSSQASLFE
jgi:serine/threonine protein phosphatase PrpC